MCSLQSTYVGLHYLVCCLSTMPSLLNEYSGFTANFVMSIKYIGIIVTCKYRTCRRTFQRFEVLSYTLLRHMNTCPYSRQFCDISVGLVLWYKWFKIRVHALIKNKSRKKALQMKKSRKIQLEFIAWLQACIFHSFAQSFLRRFMCLIFGKGELYHL